MIAPPTWPKQKNRASVFAVSQVFGYRAAKIRESQLGLSAADPVF
jgi:hypothetical protein